MSMFVARDQENIIHAHQQAAASKPLNHGLKQLAPKTPGQNPKTPFRMPLRDENSAFTFGKGTVKGNKTDKGKADIVTPLVTGPKNRAPLGQKTTNAKAKALQTPGQQKPLGGDAKTKGKGTVKANRSVKRPSTLRKKQVTPLEQPAQPSTQSTAKPVIHVQKDDEDIPEPEYAPPTPQALPDPPEPIPYDRTFPQFKGRNFARGWDMLYADPEKAERELQAKYEQHDKEIDKKILEDLDSVALHENEPSVISSPPKTRSKQTKTTPRRKEAGASATGMRMMTRAMARQLKEKEKEQQEALKAKAETPQSTPKAATTSSGRPTSSDSRTSNASTSSTLPLRPIIRKKQPRSTATGPATSQPRATVRQSESNSKETREEAVARHARAVAGSRTSLGYTKGRSLSAALAKEESNKVANEDLSVYGSRDDKLLPISDPQRYMELFGVPSVELKSPGPCDVRAPLVERSDEEGGKTSEDEYEGKAWDREERGEEMDGPTRFGYDNGSEEDTHSDIHLDFDYDEDAALAFALKESESDAEFQLTL